MINWSLWLVRLVRKAFIVSAAFNCNGKCCCGAIKNYTIASIFYIHDKCSLLISALCHNGSLIISVLKSWLRIRIWQNIDSDIFTIYYGLVTAKMIPKIWRILLINGHGGWSSSFFLTKSPRWIRSASEQRNSFEQGFQQKISMNMFDWLMQILCQYLFNSVCIWRWK